MQDIGLKSEYGLENHGLKNLKNVYWNLVPAKLVEESILRNEGELSSSGAVMVNTGQHTGRSPKDKYIVNYNNDDDKDIWWGNVNTQITPAQFENLYTKIKAYLQEKDVFVQDIKVGTHPNHQLPVRVITENAWHSLAANHLFVKLSNEELEKFVPEYTLVFCPNLLAEPKEDGIKSETFVVVNFTKKMVIVGFTGYAGEIKKSIFTVMNYVLPRQSILSMHCSANVGEKGDVALFFGLSGTGKTSLSSDTERGLIGDDQHGWSDEGIFNFEAGCYAKVINLNPDYEPLIWEATNSFSAVLENVVYDKWTKTPDFNDNTLTDNTRSAYPISYIPNFVPEGYAGHPDNVFFLTADAFGVMPPISRLTPEQAMYYFLAGYTSKLAGTEKGLGKEPQATFSSCFGAPFLPLHPGVYAKLLGEKISKHKAKVWLVNTGWTGGPYGVGERIKIPYTRAMVRAALNGEINDVELRKDTFFGLNVPTSCPDVPSDILDPIKTWHDEKGYKKQAEQLIKLFIDNFKQFEDQVPKAVVESGPMFH